MEKRRTFPILAIMLLTVLLLPPLLTACDRAEQEPLSSRDDGGGVPVAFGATALPVRVQTRSGEITTANISSMGVFASYTGQDGFDDDYLTGSLLNYMYNQKITRAGAGSPWTYSPVKYWPDKAGDKITFFAYAPHTDDIEAGAFHDMPPKTNKGEFYFYYNTPLRAEDQVDLLVATSVNTTRTGTVGLTFQHLMAKVTFQVLSSETIKSGSVVVNNATTGRGFYVGSYGFMWDSAEGDDRIHFTAAVEKNVYADTKTDVGTFFLYNSDAHPEYGSYALSVTFNYYDPDGVPRSKTATLPRGWQPGEAVNFILKLDKLKLTVTATDGDTVEWTDTGNTNIDHDW